MASVPFDALLDAAFMSARTALNKVDDEKLKELMSDDAKIEEFIRALPQVESMVTEKAMLAAENKSLAEFNLSKEPELAQAKAQLLQVYDQANALREQVQAKLTQLESVSESKSLETTLALLRTAAAEAEEESEAVKDSFLAGEIGPDEFVEDFLAKRKVGHMRRVKADKMREIMLQSQAEAQANLGPSRNFGRRPPPPPPGGRGGQRSYVGEGYWNYPGTM